MLKDQRPEDLQYMMLTYLDREKTKTYNAKRSFYIFPKVTDGGGANDVGVIGGTFIEG